MNLIVRPYHYTHTYIFYISFAIHTEFLHIFFILVLLTTYKIGGQLNVYHLVDKLRLKKAKRFAQVLISLK